MVWSQSARDDEANALGFQATLSLADIDLGMHTSGNVKIDGAIKVLRLLHVAQLRQLQTRVNEILVRVQRLTANPKTDLKLGKVGR
jgi:RLL motif-containing protein 1